MTPRTTTIAVAGVLAVLLTAIGALVPVPYVAQVPGPTTDVLGTHEGRDIVRIRGHRTYPTRGELRLTTVWLEGSSGRLDVVRALLGWLDPDVAVMPIEYVIPEGQSREELLRQDAEAMEQSQENAKAAALRHLDIPIKTKVVVRSIVEGSPALGKLKAGDVVVAVDGRDVTTPERVRDAITAHEPGETVRITVVRDGSERTVTVRTRDEGGRAVVGFFPAESFEFPFAVEIELEETRGPSAGLMFALAIVDKLTPGALAGGRRVSGTGTITPTGEVGPIGGIQQKLVAAADARAEFFLVPAANCADAIAARPAGLRLVKVEHLRGAVAALERIADGGTPPACP